MAALVAGRPARIAPGVSKGQEMATRSLRQWGSQAQRKMFKRNINPYFRNSSDEILKCNEI